MSRVLIMCLGIVLNDSAPISEREDRAVNADEKS